MDKLENQNQKNSFHPAGRDIFERLKNGETIHPNDPQAYRMLEASYSTKKLLVQMNNATDPKEIRDLLSQITANEIDESVAAFTPLYINYGKHTKIVKTYSSTSIVLSWTWEELLLMMAYSLHPKSAYCPKDTLFRPKKDTRWFRDPSTLRRTLGSVRMPPFCTA